MQKDTFKMAIWGKFWVIINNKFLRYRTDSSKTSIPKVSNICLLSFAL